MQRSKDGSKGKRVPRAGVAPPAETKRGVSARAESLTEGAMVDIPLRGMGSRQKGVIARIDAHGELGRRIRDMGLVPGTPVEVRGRAPLHDPVAVRIRDFTLTLRNNEADQIMIRVEGEQNE